MVLMRRNDRITTPTQKIQQKNPEIHKSHLQNHESCVQITGLSDHMQASLIFSMMSLVSGIFFRTSIIASGEALEADSDLHIRRSWRA